MERQLVRVLVWIAAAIPLVMDAVYLSLIRLQGESSPDVLTVPFVFGYLLVMAALLASSLLVRMNPVMRGAFRAAAGAGLVVLGVLAAFSIGLPILVAGLIALAAFGLSLERWQVSLPVGVVAGFVAVALLIGGFELTQRYIVCPESGESSGSGTGFVTGPYSWHCVNGTLTWKSGS